MLKAQFDLVRLIPWLSPSLCAFHPFSSRPPPPPLPPFNYFLRIAKTGRIDEQLVYDMSVNCTSFYMQVDFVLKSRYLDTETFRFDNNSCGSHTATSEHVSLRTPLDACGTTRRESSDAVTYFNKVVAETKGQATIYIVEFPFSCSYRTHQTIGVPSFQPRKKVTYFEGKIAAAVLIGVDPGILNTVKLPVSGERRDQKRCRLMGG